MFFTPQKLRLSDSPLPPTAVLYLLESELNRFIYPQGCEVKIPVGLTFLMLGIERLDEGHGALISYVAKSSYHTEKYPPSSAHSSL